MKLLLDMNLSPYWLPMLHQRDWESCHWSSIGKHNAPDTELMAWARRNSRVVMTQDLDFPQLLFMSGDLGPSVVLLRMKDEFDPAASARVVEALAAGEKALMDGALLIISGNNARLRPLPLP